MSCWGSTQDEQANGLGRSLFTPEEDGNPLFEQENYVPSVCHAFCGKMPNIRDL
jgi:hypothetical protein